MILREHQELAKRLARDAIRRGNKRPLIAAPTSFGKTILAADIMKTRQDMGLRGWFLCDRVNLVNQTVKKFTEFGIDFGVRQASHPMQNPLAPIQIASIQSVQAMVNKHERGLPEIDFMIVDECRTQYDIIRHIMETYDNIPVIGLDATPYSKGLGKLYNELIVPITPRELLEKGYLCPVKYYGGQHIDTSKIRSVDPNTFNQDDLMKATEAQSEILTGDIIRNWLEYGERSQTIAFSPSQNHSKYLVERFEKQGIYAEHVDCYTPPKEREELYRAHDKGEFKILSCSRLLNTGYDSPTTKCIIDCFPVKSVSTYVQRVGRIVRTAEGKDHAIYLDHAGNFERFGYAEDIVPTSLHDGEKTHRETDLIKKKDKKEAKVRDCPQCHQKMQGVRCMACGYAVPKSEVLQDDGSMLKELTEGKKANKITPIETKQQFLSELYLIAKMKGHKSGWASYKYKERFGVWPNKIKPHYTDQIGIDTQNWLKHSNIKRAKSNAKPDSRAGQ